MASAASVLCPGTDWSRVPWEHAVHACEHSGRLIPVAGNGMHMQYDASCASYSEQRVSAHGRRVEVPGNTSAKCWGVCSFEHHSWGLTFFWMQREFGYVHPFKRITEHWSWKAPLQFAWAKSLYRAGQLSALGPFSPTAESCLLSAFFLYFDPTFHFRTASFPCCQHKYQCSCLLNWRMNVPKFQLHFTICKQF